MATTADYLNKLNSLRKTLATNLTSKGVAASEAETLDILVPKVLNISGNGGEISTKFIAQSIWDTMSFEEKKAAGLTLVGESTDFYGKWYNYTNVDEYGIYLPNSDLTKIITFANVDNFIKEELSWGAGTHPIVLQDYKQIDKTENAIYIDVSSSGTLGYVDLKQTKRPCTIYAVMKMKSGMTSGYARHLSIMATKASNQGVIIYGNSIVNFSPWGTTQSTGVSATNFYVIAFNYNGSTAHCNINGKTFNNTPTNFGQYLTIGRSTYDGGNSGVNEEAADVYVKFLSIVDEAESEETIAANVTNLANQFEIVI